MNYKFNLANSLIQRIVPIESYNQSMNSKIKSQLSEIWDMIIARENIPSDLVINATNLSWEIDALVTQYRWKVSLIQSIDQMKLGDQLILLWLLHIRHVATPTIFLLVWFYKERLLQLLDPTNRTNANVISLLKLPHNTLEFYRWKWSWLTESVLDALISDWIRTITQLQDTPADVLLRIPKLWNIALSRIHEFLINLWGNGFPQSVQLPIKVVVPRRATSIGKMHFAPNTFLLLCRTHIFDIDTLCGYSEKDLIELRTDDWSMGFSRAIIREIQDALKKIWRSLKETPPPSP